MSDEVYRPQQRKPINQEDIASQPVQEQSSQPVQEQPSQLVQEQPSQPVQAVINPDSGIKIEGKIPQEFLEAQRRSQNEQGANQSLSSMNNMNKSQPQTQMQPQGFSSNNVLEDILAKIHGGNNVWEEVTLPSLGRFYNGDNGPIDGKIHIRAMTGEEEQILATPRLVKKGKALDMIFDKCIQESWKSENFLTQDRTWILIYLRGISYSPNYDVELTCPFTNQKFNTTIDLNSLYVENCPDDFGPESLNDVLPSSNLKFSYRLSIGLDDSKLQTYRDRRIKNFDLSNQPDDSLTERLSMLVESVESLTSKSDIKQVIKNLKGQDVSYLRSVINEPPFGVDTKTTIVSPYNSEEFDVDLPLEANFFFPKARKTKGSKTQA